MPVFGLDRLGNNVSAVPERARYWSHCIFMIAMIALPGLPHCYDLSVLTLFLIIFLIVLVTTLFLIIFLIVFFVMIVSGFNFAEFSPSPNSLCAQRFYAA